MQAAANITLTGARATRDVRDASEIPGSRAAVLEVRIHLPPAKSQVRPRAGRRAKERATLERASGGIVQHSGGRIRGGSAALPEPSTFALFATALVGLRIIRRRTPR